MVSLSESEKLKLDVWGLPDGVLEFYKKKGIESMFTWQLQCLTIGQVLQGGNLIYSAPTSAGKTLVAEILVSQTVFERQKKALIILPFVSVVREKMFYFKEMFLSSGIKVEGFMGGHTPAASFQQVHVAICTIEKANSIINKLLEEGEMDKLGLVVVDELHLLGDSYRGYLLELLLTKLKFFTCTSDHIKIQIVSMSATLPNLKNLADWLTADLFYTDFRPVPLSECLKCGTQVYNKKMDTLYSIVPYAGVPDDSEHVGSLCLDTIKNGHSVLIFCPTKVWCENLAGKIAVYFKKLAGTELAGSILRKELNRDKVITVLEHLKMSPAGLDKELQATVGCGVAFHHAGLTLDERDIIEGSFRQGVVRVLCATSTLSSGVNLPARRVIIRSPMSFGGVMDILTYRQMIGRAGRMGVDTEGESILICKPSEKSICQQLMCSNLKPIVSCLGEGRLSASLKRALLEVVASGVACTPAQVKLYASCTFLAFSTKCDLMDPIMSCIKFLEDNEFIRLQDNGALYKATPLGQACLASSLPPDEGLTLFRELERARRCFVLDTDLHTIYQVTPYSVSEQWGKIDWLQMMEKLEQLPPSMQRVSELVGIQEAFLAKVVKGSINPGSGEHRNKLSVHRRFYTALALQELVNEVPLTVVAARFGCNKGMLQSLQQSAATYAGMVTEFTRRLGWTSVELIISQFQERLQFGVQRELCDLMRLPLLNGARARALFNSGFKSLTTLANADVNVLENALHAVAPFQTAKEIAGETAYDLEQRKKMREIWVTGKSGVTVADAAKQLVLEARTVLELELGVQIPNWGVQQPELSQTIADTSVTFPKPVRIGVHEEAAQQRGNCEHIHQPESNVIDATPESKGTAEIISSYSRTTKLQLETVKKPSNVLVSPKGPKFMGTIQKSNSPRTPKRRLETVQKSNNVLRSPTRPKLQLETIQDSSIIFRSPTRPKLQLETVQQYSSVLVSPKGPTNENIQKPSNVLVSPKGPKNEIMQKPVAPKGPKNETMQKLSCSTFIQVQKPINVTLSPRGSEIHYKTVQIANGSKELHLQTTLSCVKSLHKTAFPTKTPPEPKQDPDIIEDEVSIIQEFIKHRKSRCFDKTTSDYFTSSVNFDNIQIDFPEVVTRKRLSEDMFAPTPKSSRPLDSCLSPDLFSESLTFDTQLGRALDEDVEVEKPPVVSASFFDVQLDTQFEPDKTKRAEKRKVRLTASPDLIVDSDESLVAEKPTKRPRILRSQSRKILSSALKRKNTKKDDSDDEILATPRPQDSFQNLSKKTRSQFKSSHEQHRDVDLIISEPKQSKLNIIDVGSNLDVFKAFENEISKQETIAMALACSKAPDTQIRRIGANIVKQKTTPRCEAPLCCYEGTRLDGIAFYWTDNDVYFLNLDEPGVLLDVKKSFLSSSFVNKKTIRIFNTKEQIKTLERCTRVLLEANFEDPNVSLWLIREAAAELTISAMVSQYYPAGSKLLPLVGKQSDLGAPGMQTDSSVSSRYRAAAESVLTFHLMEAHLPYLKQLGLEKVFRFTEMPISSCLAEMELTGLWFDRTKVLHAQRTLEQCMLQLQHSAKALCGHTVSLSSTREISKVLYKELRLEAPHGNNTGTDKETLLELGRQTNHQLPGVILQWRKLRSALSKVICPVLRLSTGTNRVFGHSQTATVTGRITMCEPNMQNVPRTFTVNNIDVNLRSVFTAPPGFVLVSADYCQIELRLLAHLSRDERLVQSIVGCKDVFVNIAAALFQIPQRQVTDTMRQKAKQTCYGMVYGVGARTLAQQLDIGEDEAASLISDFKAKHQGVREYLKETVTQCQSKGFVTTLSGRRRYLPHINNTIPALRSEAERQAVNTTVQGSAADLVKLAMVSVRREIQKENLDAKLVLHLHDELIYEVRQSHVSKMTALLQTKMESVMKLAVPIPIKICSGPSWGELELFQDHSNNRSNALK